MGGGLTQLRFLELTPTVSQKGTAPKSQRQRNFVKVAVCVPSGDEVKTDFFLSMADLLLTPNPGVNELMVLNPRTSLIENSRFLAVKDALRRGADKVLFVDSDVVFPGDALRRLLNHGKPIVGATYVRRREPYGVLGYGLEDVPPGATGLHRFARLPAGMLLIDAGVFSVVARPWFVARYQPETDDYLSEDYGFCDRVREAGFDVWCDLDLSRELGHVGSMTYTWAMSPDPPELKPRGE